MRFYNRQNELQELEKLYEQSDKCGKMTVITGRRRVGKTILSLEFAQKYKFVYLFVSKKSEHLLCMEYIDEIKKLFDIPVIGDIRAFKDVFALLMELAKHERFILIIDEFQEFYNINASIYSEIQRLWDLNKNSCKLDVIFIGSVYSLMHKIFQHSKEPLFGRADRQIFLKPFMIKTIKEILYDQNVESLQTLFDFYVITGGMPKYIDILTSNSALSLEKILDFIASANSPFIYEGKNLLIEEFGKEYGTYFSILELISQGKTSRPEIESILERNIGGYLDRLEYDYSVINRFKPINAKPQSRLQKYQISDNFLNFWFRFVYKNISTLETGNYAYVKDIIRRDYPTYSGLILEKFFRELFTYCNKYNLIGSYWEKGNQNQIDIVAVNDMERTITIVEIKMDKSKISLKGLENKSQKLLTDYRGYRPEWMGLTLEDAGGYFP